MNRLNDNRLTDLSGLDRALTSVPPGTLAITLEIRKLPAPSIRGKAIYGYPVGRDERSSYARFLLRYEQGVLWADSRNRGTFLIVSIFLLFSRTSIGVTLRTLYLYRYGTLNGRRNPIETLE